MHVTHNYTSVLPIPRCGIAVLILIAMWPGTAFNSAAVQAQSRTDSTHVPTMGALVQGTAHAESHPTAYTDGFRIDRARVSISGTPVAGLSYEVEGDFVDDLILTDAYADVTLSQRVMLRAGQFRPPFSYGQLVSSAATPFVMRARGVRAIGVSRRPGIAVTYQPATRWTVQGGMFNSTRLLAQSERPEPPEQAPASEQLMYVGRLAWRPVWDAGRAAFGVGVAYEPQGAATGARDSRYSGNLHVEHGALAFTAEALTRTAAPAGRVKTGLQVTGAYAINAPRTVRVRLDWVDYAGPTANPLDSDTAPTQLGIGYTYQPTSYLRVETDVLAPVANGTLQPVVLLTQLQFNL